MASGDIKVYQENGSSSYDEVKAQDYLLPLSGGTMTGDMTLAENVAILFDPAGSADGKFSGFCIKGTAGATLAFGELVQLSNADGRWEKVRADIAALGVGDPRGLLGICVASAAADGSATTILLQGVIRADSQFPTLTRGAQVFLSGATAGGISVTAPSTTGYVSRVVGFALTADEIYFDPSKTYITIA